MYNTPTILFCEQKSELWARLQQTRSSARDHSNECSVQHHTGCQERHRAKKCSQWKTHSYLPSIAHRNETNYRSTISKTLTPLTPSSVKCSVQFSSVAQFCLTLCNPMNLSMPGLPVDHNLPEFTQTHVDSFADAIPPSHPLLSPSPAPSPSQHQGLFQ